jgi:hypothetical protein
MTIRVTKLLHSIPEAGGKAIATFELYYPREILHEEFLTHRSLSRSSSSSRATPIQSMVDQVRRDPAMPIRWGLNGKGMQDHGEMTEEESAVAKAEWLAARDDALLHVGNLLKMTTPPHKQITNLLLRPWEHITTVVTATEWANFLAVRRHPDAKPEFFELADLIYKSLREGEPQVLRPGEWHLPYIQKHEADGWRRAKPDQQPDILERLKKVSAARCARTSYKNHRNKVASFAEDEQLYNFLATNVPPHPSPLEHQATPDTFHVLFDPATKKVRKVWEHPELHGNLVGWVQQRKTLPGENITIYNPEE